MMRKKRCSHLWGSKRLWILLPFFLFTGCGGPDLNDYQDRAPVLVPEQFFTGKLSARGLVKDWSGAVIRTFDADIKASWTEQGVGTLDEVFRFNDGELQTRVWTLTPEPGGDSYRASAGDVTKAGIMRWSGNAIQMNYRLELAYGDGTIEVGMDDWMYLITPDTLINQTTMSKWGLNVGEVILVIQKQT